MPEYPTNPKYTARQHDDLAAFIKEELPGIGYTELHEEQLAAAKRRVAERLADRFAKDNPQFDRKRFLEACGVEGEPA